MKTNGEKQLGFGSINTVGAKDGLRQNTINEQIPNFAQSQFLSLANRLTKSSMFWLPNRTIGEDEHFPIGFPDKPLRG